MGAVDPVGGGGGVDPGAGAGGAGAGDPVAPVEPVFVDNVIIRGEDKLSAPTSVVNIPAPTVVDFFTAVLFQSLDRTENELATQISDSYFADTLLTSSFSDFILKHLTTYDFSAAMSDFNNAVADTDEANVQRAEANQQTLYVRQQNVDYNTNVAGPYNADVQALRDAAIAENILIQEFNDLQDANEAQNLIIEAENAVVQACLDGGGDAATCGVIQPLLPVEPHKELLDENVGTLLPLKDPQEGEILQPLAVPDVETYLNSVRDVSALFIAYLATQKQYFPETDEKFEILVDTLFANFEQVNGLIPEIRDDIQTQEGGAAADAGIGALGAISGNNGVDASVTELMDFVIYSITLTDYQTLTGSDFLEGRELTAEQAFQLAQVLAASQGIGGFISGALSDPGSVALEDLQEFVRILLLGDSTVGALTPAQQAILDQQQTLLTIAQAIRQVEEAQAELADEAAFTQAVLDELRKQGQLADIADDEIVALIEQIRASTPIPGSNLDPVRQQVVDFLLATQGIGDPNGRNVLLRDLISTAVSTAFSAAPLAALQQSLETDRGAGLSRSDQLRVLIAGIVVNNLIGLADGENFNDLARQRVDQAIKEIETDQVREAVSDSLVNIARLGILRIADLILAGAGRDIEGRITGLGIIDVETRLAEVTDRVVADLEENNLEFIVESFRNVSERHVSMEAWLAMALDPAMKLVLEDSMFRGDSGPASLYPDKRRPIEGPA